MVLSKHPKYDSTPALLEVYIIIRVSEPGGSKTLRHHVDILLLELMKAYIFFYHSRNITKKFGPLFTIF